MLCIKYNINPMLLLVLLMDIDGNADNNIKKIINHFSYIVKKW